MPSQRRLLSKFRVNHRRMERCITRLADLQQRSMAEEVTQETGLRVRQQAQAQLQKLHQLVTKHADLASSPLVASIPESTKSLDRQLRLYANLDTCLMLEQALGMCKDIAFLLQS